VYKRFTQLLRNTSDAAEHQVAMIFHNPHDKKQNIFLPLPTQSPCLSTSFRSSCIFHSFAPPERRKLVVFLIVSPIHNAQRYYMPTLPIFFHFNLPQNFFRLTSTVVHGVVY